MRTFALPILAAGALLTGACVVTPNGTYVPAAVVQPTIIVEEPPAPPPPRYIPSHRRPACPSRHHVWVKGYWDWHGGRYVWRQGHWHRPPRRGSRYVHGHWKRRGKGHVWVEAHWSH